MKFRLLTFAALILAVFTTSAFAAPAGIDEGLIDQEARYTLGLPTVPGVHRTLYFSADETFRFSHHPNLAIYEGKLIAMWSSGIRSEDERGQRVLWTSTDDGEVWRGPEVLVPAPDGLEGPMLAVAAGFHVDRENDRLVAFYSSIPHARPIDPDSALYAIASSDGKEWGSPVRIVDGFFIEKPRRIPSGRIFMGGQFNPAEAGANESPPRLIYTDSPDGLDGWKDAEIPPFPGFVGRYPEPNWYLRPDGTMVMLLRAPRGIPWLYASESTDDGETWSEPARTNIPSATARMATGNLPDGRAFCVWNPSREFGRNPLVIALSEDGKVFDRAYVIRGEATTQRFDGARKSDGWQYPSVIVWQDYLWVAYSVNKEDVKISRIRLTDLR